jgi:putative MFS transporter
MKSTARMPLKIVFAASLGYFVDLFDTFLMPALRSPSLRDMGVIASRSLVVGTNIFNLQLLGQTMGALLIWGPLADRLGRKKILFGSILLYGLGSFATAFSHSTGSFAVMRFIAGLGLGGELGAGIALIAETMKQEDRTKGTMIVGFFGMLGVVLAGLIAESSLSWRTDYVIGGVLAVVVLVFRLGVHESDLFVRSVSIVKPPYWKILGYLVRPANLLKFVACVFVGAPTFFVVGLLVSGAPEFGTALGMQVKPTSATALVWTYTSIAVGDIFCGLLAQALRSRKAALVVFQVITLIGFSLILFVPAASPMGYYWRCALTGLGIGYWANMVTNASEQWGTNVRGTVTIAVPNFVRLLLFPISSMFLLLRPHFGYISAAAMVGVGCSVLAILSILLLSDGFSRDLNFAEPI